jgi:cyanophycinase
MAEASSIIAILGGQDAVWLTGSNAQELGVALGGTATARALEQRFRNGMTLGGDRAGAAMLGAVMVTGGDDPPPTRRRRRRAAQDTGIATAEGLGVVIGSLIYAPSSERHRPTALNEAIAIHTRLLGVMLDSAAAIAVENDGTWMVVGDQPVELVEIAPEVSVPPDSAAAADSANFVTRTLSPGERFDPRSRAVRTP